MALIRMTTSKLAESQVSNNAMNLVISFPQAIVSFRLKINFSFCVPR